MVSFELGKEIEKDVFRPVMSVRQRKNSECPGGFKPQTCGFCATTEPRDYFSLSHARDKTKKHFSRSSIVDDGAFFL